MPRRAPFLAVLRRRTRHRCRATRLNETARRLALFTRTGSCEQSQAVDTGRTVRSVRCPWRVTCVDTDKSTTAQAGPSRRNRIHGDHQETAGTAQHATISLPGGGTRTGPGSLDSSPALLVRLCRRLGLGRVLLSAAVLHPVVPRCGQVSLPVARRSIRTSRFEPAGRRYDRAPRAGTWYVLRTAGGRGISRSGYPAQRGTPSPRRAHGAGHRRCSRRHS